MKPIAMIKFVVAFGAARGGLFLAPILVANLLPVAAYGQIELAQATASIAALVIGFGLPATVPLILVRRGVRARWDTLLFIMCCLGLGLLVLSLSQIGFAPSVFSLRVLVPLATALLMLQGLWSVTLKSQGRGTQAVFLETGYWLAVLGGAVLVSMFTLSSGWMVGFLAVFAFSLFLVTFRQFMIHRAPFGLPDIGANLRLGSPLMLAGLLSMIASTAGRLLLGQTAGVEAVGLYAILFRSTALPIVAHQILVIAFYRQIFSWEMPILRYRSPIIIWGIGLIILLFWVLVSPLGWLLGSRFVDTFDQYEFEGKVILLQTVLWSAIALNDMLSSRMQIAGAVARWTGPFLAISLAAVMIAMLAHPGINESSIALPFFVPVYAALMFGYFTVQCAAMAKQKQLFTRLWGSTLLIFVGGMITLVIEESFA